MSQQLQISALFAVLLLYCGVLQVTDGELVLQLRNEIIPTNGSGKVLITSIGSGNNDALLCVSEQPDCCAGATNWYYDYGGPRQRRVQSNDVSMGWIRNRGKNPGVVRLRSRRSNPQPGDSREGIYTCEVEAEGIVSVGLYYSIEVELTFTQDSNNIMSPSYTITCTATGGTVLSSFFTGPNGESLDKLAGVEPLQMRGRDTYTATITRSGGNNGDTYYCMASNGASTSSRNYTISAALSPTNIAWEQVAPSVLRLNWVQPEGGAPVRSYTITTLYGNGVVVSYVTLKPRNRAVTIQRLVNDGREYTIIIAAMSDDLNGITTVNAYLTRFYPPSVTITNITDTTATLFLSTNITLTPDRYELVFSRITGEGQIGGCPMNDSIRTFYLNSTQLTVTLEDLEEASTYSVTTQALSSLMGDSSVSSPMYFSTLEAAPSKSPSNLRVSAVTSSEAELRWDAISSCLDINGIASGWQIRYWPTPLLPTVRPDIIFIPGSPMAPGDARVRLLQPYTNYIFEVAVVTSSRLVGVYSEPVTITTLETVPGLVTAVTEKFQNATIIVVSWQPPYPSNGPITSYRVSFWLVADPTAAQNEYLSREETSFPIPIPSGANIGQELLFSVTAVSRMGAGPPALISIRIAPRSNPTTGPRPGQPTASSVIIQIQFGPIDYCISWTEERMLLVEQAIREAIINAIRKSCPNCGLEIFLGFSGVFVCQDNPYMASYRCSIDEANSSVIVPLIQQWVSESPFLRIGWLLVKINPDCPTHIPSLDVLEQPVAMAPTNHTISLPGTAQELVNTCMTELNRLCNTTLINGIEDSYT